MVELPVFRASAAFTPVEKLVLELAEAMTATPTSVTDELFDRVRRHFDDAQLVELVAAIAWENHRARFNRTFAIASQNFSEGAFCALPEHHPAKSDRHAAA